MQETSKNFPFRIKYQIIVMHESLIFMPFLIVQGKKL